jgi:hypothetical protein
MAHRSSDFFSLSRNYSVARLVLRLVPFMLHYTAHPPGRVWVRAWRVRRRR